MGTKMVDVTLHVDETLSHDQRERLRDVILAQDGVMAVSAHDEQPHLMIVEYNPDTVDASDLLGITESQGVHAELVGL